MLLFSKNWKIKMIIIIKRLIPLFFVTILILGCKENKSLSQTKKNEYMEINTKLDTATFGTGCFWCSQAIFERLKGVESAVAGYSGGTTDDPTYEQVCTGKTGYAEVCQVTYDPNVISYDELLKVFWKTHDPTTLNRQGADVGTQYRSVIFYHNEDQKKKAEYYKEELNNSGAWKNPVVTEISPFTKFYEAEDYHQDYFEKNPNQGYCAFVIAPKLEKFEKVFKDKLK
jgi:peptide-methionine (S)-S-oxide reductase